MTEDGMVIIPKMHNGGRSGVYHTDEECRNLPHDGGVRREREKLDRGRYRECKVCAGDVDHATERKRSLRQMMSDAEDA